jgi:putative hydrolases of HD superfamily
METHKAVNFIFELAQLKRIKHCGVLRAGVDNPDSVAEHVMRAAQIGYILAVMEGDVNPERVASMVLVHDNGEARIGDQERVAAHYYSNKRAEKKAFKEQLKDIDSDIAKTWEKYFNEYTKKNTKEGILARDADLLELAFQVKEYIDEGHEAVKEWIKNVKKELKSKSAKELLKDMEKTKFTEWWEGLD